VLPVVLAAVTVIVLVGGATLVLRLAADSPTGGGAGSPPLAVMRADSGASVRGGTGTYCWQTGGHGACADAIGAVTNVEPLALGVSEGYTLEFGDTPPDSTEPSWVAVSALRQPRQSGDILIWIPDGASGVVWIPGPSTQTRPQLPGEYLVVVRALWDDLGVASYGFYVEVR
jgi:hypothetical protein